MVVKNLTVAVLHSSGKFESIYEYIDSPEEAYLLAQLAMTRKTNWDDLIVIFPGNNLSIDQTDKELYKKALLVEQKYFEIMKE